MAGGILMPTVEDDNHKKKVLIRRRAVLLAVCAATATSGDSVPLKKIVESGLLTNIKSWIDSLEASTRLSEYLSHILRSLIYLPVTKSTITKSKVGRAVVALANEGGIVFSIPDAKIRKDLQNYIGRVKTEWSATVKKENNSSGNISTVDKDSQAIPKRKDTLPKRPRDVETTSTSVATNESSVQQKKKKVSTNVNSISNLIRKTASLSGNATSAADLARQRAKERLEKTQANLNASVTMTETKKPSTNVKSVHWEKENLESVVEVETMYTAPKRRKSRKEEINDEKLKMENAK